MRSLKRKLATFLGAAFIGMSCGGNVYAGFTGAIVRGGLAVAGLKGVDLLVNQVIFGKEFGPDKMLFEPEISEEATKDYTFFDKTRNFWNLADRHLLNSVKGSKGLENGNVSKNDLLIEAFNKVKNVIDGKSFTYKCSVAGAVRNEYLNLAKGYVSGKENWSKEQKDAFINDLEAELRRIDDKVFLTCDGKFAEEPLPIIPYQC